MRSRKYLFMLLRSSIAPTGAGGRLCHAGAGVRSSSRPPSATEADAARSPERSASSGEDRPKAERRTHRVGLLRLILSLRRKRYSPAAFFGDDLDIWPPSAASSG